MRVKRKKNEFFTSTDKKVPQRHSLQRLDRLTQWTSTRKIFYTNIVKKSKNYKIEMFQSVLVGMTQDLTGLSHHFLQVLN